MTRRLTIALASTLAAGGLAFGLVAPPERCPTVDATALRRSAAAAVDWFARNQAPDGTWLYLYDAEADVAAPDYNLVRHAGAVEGLYQAASFEVAGALASADDGLAWALHRIVERDGWAALADGDPISAGATALLAAGLVERRAITGDTRHDGLLRRLGRFLEGQVAASGAVFAYRDAGTGRPVPGEFSKYYTGETYWALTRLHHTFPGEGWGRSADRVGAYLATRRDDAEDRWPPIPDHWAGYGLAETVRFPERRGHRPLTAAEVAYARRQAGLFGGQVRWVSQRFGPWGAVVRTPHVPRGGGYGVVGEGLTGLWRAARADERLADLAQPLADRAACIAGLAVRAQTRGRDAERYAVPGRVAGSWVRDGGTRMDDQQHALDALLRTTVLVEAGPRGGASRPSASGWLWALALLAAVNPARAALALGPNRGRGVMFTGAAGVVAGAALAGVSGPLLDALGVSWPSARIAGGAVVLVAGAADLVRRSTAAEPVAVLAIVRPALVIAALGAGAEHGWPLAAAPLAVAVALMVAIGGASAEVVARRRIVEWLARLAGAGAVGAGVLLIVHGVLDV